MAYPNPDAYEDWKDWAKAVAAYSDRSQNDEDREFEEAILITEWYQDWAPYAPNPMRLYKTANGLCVIVGQSVSITSTFAQKICTLPVGCWPKVPGTALLAEWPSWYTAFSGPSTGQVWIAANSVGTLYQGAGIVAQTFYTFNIVYETKEGT